MVFALNNNYKQASLAAFEKSKELGLEPKLDFNNPITTDKIEELKELCNQEIIHSLINLFGRGYWGTSCLGITSRTMQILKNFGIDCELVYGDVNINGTDEYDTTLDGLMSELNNPGRGEFQVHTWIQVGENLIIDPTVAARLNKYYSPEFPSHYVVVGKSNELLNNYRLDYRPMLLGENYLDKTNSRFTTSPFDAYSSGSYHF